MKQIEFNWTTNDQINIYAKEWRVENPKAVISLVHGMGEHVNRYNHLAAFFNQQGIAVVGYDRRGHGKSGGKRGHTTNYEAFLDEVADLLVETETRYPNVPTFLYGHSMGGNIALKYSIDRHPNVSGVIATGPLILLAFQPSKALWAVAKVLRSIYPGFSQENDLNAHHLSHDPVVNQAYIDDPLVHTKITSATAVDMIGVGEWLNTFSGTLKIPTLIMHGAEDKITSAPASEAFARRVKGDVTFRSWEKLYHEIHNEPEQKKIFEYTLSWLQKRIKK